MTNNIYNKQGEEITGEEWAKLLSDMKYKIVKQDELENGKWVSTIWLGLDHNWGDGEPLIFEAMVFESSSNYSELDCERYATEEEALKGHEEMVNKYK